MQILDYFLDGVCNVPLDIRITFFGNLSFSEIFRVVFCLHFWIASSTNRGDVLFLRFRKFLLEIGLHAKKTADTPP